MTSNGNQSGKPLRAGDPRELDGYRIVSRLGRGGMGTVYLARDAADRPVAVKLIHPDLADDESFRLRFAREVQAARRVARFSTAAVIDARLDGDPLFIVSEYVPGPNLDEAVRASGPMGGGTLEGLAMGVAAALTAIHGSGVIHRDLKPANVLLSQVGPKVIDFGIARALDESDAVTRSSQLMGTPAYTAPELILGERPGASADIFAWGCLVAFAGTGTAPFEAPTVPAVLHNITSAPPRLEGLEPNLRDLVAAALDKDPRNRPTSQQLLARLTGQEAPEEVEVSRSISTAWAPPSSAPVPGRPPLTAQHTRAAGAEQAQPPGAGQPPAVEQPPGADQRPGGPGPHPSGPQQGVRHTGRPGGGQPLPPARFAARNGPSGPYPPPGQPAYGGYSPPGGQQTFAARSGPGVSGDPGGPGGREAAGGPGQPAAVPGGAPAGRGRGRMLVLGAAALAVVGLAGAGAVVLLDRPPSVPENVVSIYDTDFSTNDEWSRDVYQPGESDGYWAEQRGLLVRLDPSTHESRGEMPPLEQGVLLHDSVLVSTTAYVVEGPEQAMFGVRCWDTEGEEHRTQYEALLRSDGRRAEIRRMHEAEGDRTLAQSTDVAGFEPYPLFEESARPRGYEPGTPYRFVSEEVPLNTVTLLCALREDRGGDPSMELSLWVNGEHVLTTVDDSPLPGGGAPGADGSPGGGDDAAEELEDHSRVGVVTRRGPGNEQVGVLFTEFTVSYVPEEE
ncbi:serine/threonine-protein kinase [Nocardiopsis sp. FR6]|uniref:serine/threonine-protein kinase n=1 Tax=Nocardiopsis sp. FR6 TaxID=2605986 RepID=UPI00135B75C7|nr:serine/threonine-protein kinase [Nocardiopsis sp. FR6]